MTPNDLATFCTTESGICEPPTKALTLALRVQKKSMYGTIDVRRNKVAMERRIAWMWSGTEGVRGPVIVVIKVQIKKQNAKIPMNVDAMVAHAPEMKMSGRGHIYEFSS